MSVTRKENKDIFLQLNLMTNLLHSHIVAQLPIIPEGLNLFKTPPAPLYQSLSQFTSKSSTIQINGYEIYSIDDDLTAKDGKNRKLGCIISLDMDSYLYHLKNFNIIIVFYLSDYSYLKIQLKSAIKIIKRNLIRLKAMQKSIEHLPSKILYFIYLKL